MENMVKVEVNVRDWVLKPVSKNPRHWGCCSDLPSFWSLI